MDATVNAQPANRPARRRAKPSISVILPVHNGERYLAQALNSVVAQTPAVSEIVIIDDGSTDGSMDVVRRFADSGLVRFVLLALPGTGQSAARNEGASHASGDYLAFIDQDDVWLAGHIEQLASRLDDEDACHMVYSDINTIDAEGGMLTMRLNSRAGNSHPKSSILDIISDDVMALPSATLVRRDAFIELGGYDETLQGYEDDDLYLRGFRAGWNPKFVTESRVNYRIHGSGSSMSPSFRASRLKFSEKVATMFPDSPQTRTYFVRDFLLPRMRRSFMMDYSTALALRDYASARAIARDLRTLLKSTTGRTRLRLSLKSRAGLWLLDHPKLARNVLRARPSVLRGGAIPAELRF
jgi:glycosyltransferase involved in cell wall biosynthesis